MDAVTNRATRLLLLLAILFTAVVHRIRSHHEVHFCGTPEIPAYGSVNPVKARYEVNETVGFSCDIAYILQGATIGVCLQNETWSVQSPSCDLNVAYKQHVNRTKGQISNPPFLAVDGNRDTCTDITSPPTASLSIYLPKVYNIKYILLDLEPGNMYNLSIMAVDGNSHQMCGQIVGEVYNKTSRVDCNQGYGIAASELQIRNKLSRLASTVKICEVIAIADERSCGTPEIPTHMQQLWVVEGSMVQYQCFPGYRIIGEAVKSCMNGVWESPPRCLHANDVCGHPGTPIRGTVSPRNEAYAINDNVTYNCAEGLTVVGAERRTCLENGTWSSKVPKCELNLALGMSANSAAGFNKHLIVDGNVDSCDKIDHPLAGQKPSQAQLLIQLEKEVNVATVKITLRVANKNYSMDVAIMSTRNQPKLVQACNKFQGFSETKSLNLDCQQNLGDQVIITNTDPQSASVVLCEVEVAATSSEDSLSCGEPEIPLHAETIEVDVYPQKKRYICAEGYQRIGPEHRTCQSGTWDGKLPKCQKLENDDPYGDLPESPNEEHQPELNTPTSVTKEHTEGPLADKENDPNVVVGVMGIALGVTAASISILCAVITIIIVMRKCRKTPRCRIPSHSTEDGSSRGSSRRNANWEDASMHYYDTVKDTDLPAYCESSCRFPQDRFAARRAQLPVPQYDVLDAQCEDTRYSDPEAWTRAQRTNLHENVTTV